MKNKKEKNVYKFGGCALSLYIWLTLEKTSLAERWKNKVKIL